MTAFRSFPQAAESTGRNIVVARKEMVHSSDAWYVRLPDGRVLRAASTAAVRHHVDAGRVPRDSLVRRSADEEWIALEWTQEFADLIAVEKAASLPEGRRRLPGEHPLPEPSGIAARLDPLRLRTVGVRGMAEELVAALDISLVRSKLIVACSAALLIALAARFATAYLEFPQALPAWQTWGIVGLFSIAVGAVCNSLLTQMTYVEVSRLRRARWTEARAGLLRHGFRLVLAYVVVAGGGLACIAGLRWLADWLPDWLPGAARGWGWSEGAAKVLADVVPVVALLVEIVLWVVLSFTWLLAPIAIVEEASLPSLFMQWGRLLTQHLGRVLLYEALAVVLAILATLPFAIPVALAAVGWRAMAHSAPATSDTLYILAGLITGPALAYVAVANVFIYLNQRYEYTPPERA